MQELTVQGTVKKIIAGTVVVTAVSTRTSLTVFTDAQLAEMLGVPVSAGNTVCLFANGDGSAQSAHVDGATHYQGEWRATLDRNPSAGSFRVNYTAMLF